eukprot:m.27911 g.27911  ORF g.27911 m.27911 type:complete len:223 (-) comp6488_c0_seq1:1255-1923(-)
MAVHRRVSGPGGLLMGGTAIPNHAPGFLDNVSPITAKRYALVGVGIVFVMGVCLSVLSERADELSATVLERASALAEPSEREHQCEGMKNIARAELEALTQDRRKLRREKNANVMKFNREEKLCERTLSTLKSVKKVDLNYEITSLEAKLGSDEVLIIRHRMVEALAKLQDRRPVDLWDNGKAEQEQLRNSLILEMSQLLPITLHELQSMHNVELVQQVYDL